MLKMCLFLLPLVWFLSLVIVVIWVPNTLPTHKSIAHGALIWWLWLCYNMAKTLLRTLRRLPLASAGYVSSPTTACFRTFRSSE